MGVPGWGSRGGPWAASAEVARTPRGVGTQVLCAASLCRPRPCLGRGLRAAVLGGGLRGRGGRSSVSGAALCGGLDDLSVPGRLRAPRGLNSGPGRGLDSAASPQAPGSSQL